MKKFLLGLGAAALIATTAQAVSFEAGDFIWHLRDGSSLYRAGTALPPANVALVAPEVGDENRAVFQLDQNIQSTTQTIPEGVLTGLFYGTNAALVLPSVDPLGHTIFDIYYTGGTRNPLALDADAPVGSGGVVELYMDSTVENNQADANKMYDQLDPQGTVATPTGTAPTLWQESSILAGGRDAFPNVNVDTLGTAADDSTLFLSAVLAPIGFLADGTPILLHETINTWTGSGVYDAAFLNIIGGSFADSIGRDIYGPGRDVELQLTVQGYGLSGLPTSYNIAPDNAAQRGGWQVRSSDPVTGFISVPEPASLTLVGMGIASLIGLRRRVK